MTTTTTTTTLDGLTTALAERRAAAAAGARDAFRALVLSLADGADVDPEHAAEVLRGASATESALVAAVERVRAQRTRVAQARRVPELRAATGEARSALEAASALLASETARLELAHAVALDRHVTAQHAEREAAEALDHAIAGAPAALVARYHEVSGALSRVEGALAEARMPRAAERPLPTPFREAHRKAHDRGDDVPEALAAAVDAARVVGDAMRALAAFRDRPRSTVDSVNYARFREEEARLEAAVNGARDRYADALCALADDAERTDVTTMRQAVAEALEAVLAADADVTPAVLA